MIKVENVIKGTQSVTTYTGTDNEQFKVVISLTGLRFLRAMSFLQEIDDVNETPLDVLKAFDLMLGKKTLNDLEEFVDERVDTGIDFIEHLMPIIKTVADEEDPSGNDKEVLTKKK